MKARWSVAAAPLILSFLIYVVLQSVIASGSSPDRFYLAAKVLAFAGAAVGCAIAALQFDATDYMRKAWIWMGLSNVLLLAIVLLFGAHVLGHFLADQVEKILVGVLVAIANAGTVVGELLVARTWSATGMDFQVSRTVRVAAIVGSVVLALVIAGSTAWHNLHLVTSGHLEKLTSLFSAVGDIIALAVLAPILLTALSLRGGSLIWPWGMLVVATFGWVLFDGAASVTTWMQINPAHVRPLSEAIRMCACMAYLSAGLLQRSARLDVVAPPSPALG